MDSLALATLLLCQADASTIQTWMQHAFYPVLLGILVVASLGIPIPEDIPLIAAGVLLKTHAGIASWPGTLVVALAGIMTGDLVLYTLGKRWGPDVVNHRFVRRLITPAQFVRTSRKFHRYGMWFCFFGRFFVGIRAVMCMTAGATRFPYGRFFIADCAGAMLSIPFFVYLGYWFAGMIPTLRTYVVGVQGGLAAVAVVVVIVAALYYRHRRRARLRRAEQRLAVRRSSADRVASTAAQMPAEPEPDAKEVDRTGEPPERPVPADAEQ